MLMLIATPVWSWAEGAGGEPELRLAGPREPLSLNEPVVALLSVTNAGDGGIHLSLDAFGRQHVNVNVVDPLGHPSYVTADEARTCFDCVYTPAAGTGREVLDSGQTAVAALVLNRWSRFAATGDYEVYVEVHREALVDTFEALADQVTTQDDGTPFLRVSDEALLWLEEPVLRSNAITVSVGPRDEERLSTAASALLRRAERRDALAAMTLAWMVDLAALPALAQLVRLGPAQHRAEILAASIRTGSEEAVRLLLRLGDLDDPVLGHDRVRHGLRRISQSPSASTAARRRAEEALSKQPAEPES